MTGRVPDHDFFIAYSLADGAWAEWIAALLPRFPRPLLQWAITEYGPSPVHQMAAGIRRSERTIALLSPDFVRMAGETDVWRDLLAKDRAPGAARLLTVRVSTGKVPSRHVARYHLDVTAMDEDAAGRRLMATIDRMRSGRPPFPEPARPAPAPAGADIAPGVFLCHSSGDKEQVRALYRKLCDDGVDCWFDEESLRPGQDFDLEIRRAIRRARYVLACLSHTSVAKRGYVQKELRRALDVADEQPEGSTYLIPVRLEDCEVPERLSHLQWVDLFADGGYERLLAAVGRR